VVDCFAEQRRLGPTGTRLDVGTVELVELDCLTARLNERRSSRETTPKGHIGWREKSTAKFFTSKPNASGWSGILRVKSFIVCSLGQTVAITSMISAMGECWWRSDARRDAIPFRSVQRAPAAGGGRLA